MRETRRVAIVDNSINHEDYSPVEHWRRHLDIPWEAFRANRGRFPDLDRGYTHVILTGSEASILDREEWVLEEAELARQAVRRGLAVLGSCYGHQVLALALAGPDHVRRCLRPEVGWIPIHIRENSSVLGDPRTAYTFSVHFDEVADLDEQFLVLASTEACPVQAVALKDKPVWGFQIHPEIDIPTGRRLLRRFASLSAHTRALYETALAGPPRDDGLIRGIVRHFLLC